MGFEFSLAFGLADFLTHERNMLCKYCSFCSFFFNNVKRSTNLKAYVCSVHERKCIRNCKTCGYENHQCKIIG